MMPSPCRSWSASASRIWNQCGGSAAGSLVFSMTVYRWRYIPRESDVRERRKVGIEPTRSGFAPYRLAMVSAVRSWELASAACFLYNAPLAARRPGDRWRRVAGWASAGLGLTILSTAIPRHAVLHGWLIPPSLLLLGYWTSGLLFVKPMPSAERWLERGDEVLGIRGAAARMPRGI